MLQHRSAIESRLLRHSACGERGSGANLTEIHRGGAVGHILPGVAGGGIGSIAALAHVHDMEAVELLDPELLGQLIGDIIAYVIQDAGSLALEGAGDGSCGSLDRAEEAADTAAVVSGRWRRAGCCRRCRGGIIADHVADEVVAESGRVEEYDVVLFQCARFLACEQGHEGEGEGRHGEDERQAHGELHRGGDSTKRLGR